MASKEIKYGLEDEEVTPTGSGEKNHLAFAVIIDQGKLYTDIPGKFPVRSRNENYLVILCYSYDCNYIIPVTMKSKSASEWLRTFGGIFDNLT